jgi:hypothetical protein
MDYPDNCIRGVKDPNHFTPDGTVGAEVFYFHLADRGDGWKEESINWQDHDSVVQFTLNQLKTDGNPLFRGGIVVLPLEAIDRINKLYTLKGFINYERKPLPDNRYHGNILLKADTTKKTNMLIAANLAGSISDYVKR